MMNPTPEQIKIAEELVRMHDDYNRDTLITKTHREWNTEVSAALRALLAFHEEHRPRRIDPNDPATWPPAGMPVLYRSEFLGEWHETKFAAFSWHDAPQGCYWAPLPKLPEVGE